MMMNFRVFFKRKMVRFFAILFACIAVIGNLGFYLIAKIQYNREVDRQNNSFAAMMTHLITMESIDTTLIYIEHYDHTHGVNIAFWNEDNQLLFESVIMPTRGPIFNLYDSENQLLGKVMVDNQSSFFGKDISIGFIIYNVLTLFLFIVGLSILRKHLDHQYEILNNDLNLVGNDNGIFVFADIESINERYIKALKIETELKTIQSHYVKILAHDIKTPLTVMKAYLEGIQSNRLVFSKDIGNELLEEVNSIEKLIPQFIATDINQLAIHQNITPLIKNHLIKLMPVFKTKYIDVQENLEDLELTISATDIIRIIEHLTFNAFYYSKPHVIIQITIDRVKRSLSVIDQGIGMSDETIKKILEGPYRHEESIRFHQKGSGIGLQIVKDIVHKYNGILLINSIIDKGTNISIIFPEG